MDFREAEDYLFSLGNEVETMKLGLANITALLTTLGKPQERYLKVQVAGTNGKGSVCAFLDSICLEAGIRTGVFTSPHLISVTERVRINGEDISETDFANYASRVRKAAERLVTEGKLETVPTYFEQVTAVALVAFSEAEVELAILETGLGGRFDATTAANAEVAVITRIDMDHQEYLGDTVEKIAAEKAAIITANTLDVVLGDQDPVVLQILRERCREMQITPSNDLFKPWSLVWTSANAVRAELTRHVIDNIRLGIKGRHQIENAFTAVQTAQCLKYSNGIAIDEAAIVVGLEKARNPGRLERTGNFLLDGAHNLGGAAALAAYLDEFVHQPITMIFGAMREKNVAEIAEVLWPKAAKLILTRPSNTRAMTADELLRFLPSSVDPRRVVLVDQVEEAVKTSGESPQDAIIVVTGSLYLVGEVKRIIGENPLPKFEI